MRKTISTILFGAFFALILASCDKSKVKMEVVRDCTGVYLRDKAGKDFKVCNEDRLSSYSTGTKIRVSFDNLNECSGLIEDPSCTEEHLFEGKIEITNIY